MKIMKKINTLNSVIQTTEGRKNLGITQSMLPRSFASLWMTVAMVLAFAGCSEEDLVQPANSQAGTLHITSVIIDGQEVGRSRVVGENGGTYTINNLPANHSITGFSEGDEIQLYYSFEPVSWDEAVKGAAEARFDDNSWTITDDEDYNGDDVINPDFDNGEKWEDVKMYASVVPASEGPRSLGRQAEGSNTTPQYVLGDIDDEDVWQVTDCLYASTEDRSITVDTDLKSPTLGAVTIRFKHQDALLRLPIPESGFNVAGTYVVDGTAYNVTGLATLWAFLDGNCYVPFTQVGNNLQAIVYSGVSLVGFKAVLYATEVAAENTPMPRSTGSEPSTITLDLPFKVGGSARTGIVLEENTQYPLTLTLRPNQAQVNLASATGKPGWAVDVQEHEFDNSENEFELKYIAGENGAAGTFIVKTPQALQNLNLWMVGTKSTAYFKALGYAGCGDIADDISNANRYAQNITLAADITLPTVGEGESNWTPIGNSSNIYSGVFDGNNKTIKNLTIVDGSSFYLGLIGTLSGTVQNLKLKNAKIDGSTFRKQNFSQVGGIVGAMQDGARVLGCTVSGNIWGGNSYVGGIVGKARKGILIENCTTAEGSVVKGLYVGGILGESDSDVSNRSSVTGCINWGTVIRPQDNSNYGYVGGIVANGDDFDITNCTNYGALTSDDAVYMGGIIGGGISCKLENCTNMETATLTVTSKTSDKYTHLGGIIGYAHYLVQVKGCMNHAAITHTYNSSHNYIGGIVGKMNDYNNGDGFVACGNTGSITLQKMDGITYSSLYVGGIAGYNNDTDCKYRGCWTKDVVEYNYSMTAETTVKDGFGYVYDASPIINSYTASAKTEGTTDQAFINGKTGYTDDETSDEDEGMSMNKALETLFYASGKPGASLSTKYYWNANTNGGWPTLTTTAPTMPTGN